MGTGQRTTSAVTQPGYLRTQFFYGGGSCAFWAIFFFYLGWPGPSLVAFAHSLSFLALAFESARRHPWGPVTRANLAVFLGFTSTLHFVALSDFDAGFIPMLALIPMVSIVLGGSSPITLAVSMGGMCCFISYYDFPPAVTMSPFLFPAIPTEWLRLLRTVSLASWLTFTGFFIFYFQRRMESLLSSKRRALAIISHEIRTPLHSILSNATELSRQMKGSREVELLLEDSSHLVDLTNDVLDLSKMEDELVESPELKPVATIDISRKIRSLVRGLLARESSAGHNLIEVDVVFDERIPQYTLLDGARLLQVGLNFCSNALKYGGTDRALEIRLHIVAGPPYNTNVVGQLKVSESYLQLDVSDYGGPGVSDPQDLFTPFGGGREERNKQGRASLGLGLAICKLNASRMNGAVFYRRHGVATSVFSVIVPLVEATQEQFHAAEDSNLTENLGEMPRRCSLRLLVVDDQPMNLKIIGRMLKKFGFVFETASNVQEAVAAAKQGSVFDCFLLDFQLSGSETALDVLRNVPTLRLPKYGTLVQSAHSLRDVRDACEDEGCVGLILKPFTEKHLEDALNAVFRGGRYWK